MNTKGIAVLSAAIITVGSIFGMAYADNTKTGVQQIPENKKAVEQSNFIGSCHSSIDGNKDMVKIMEDNGFGDAARYMQTGDYGKMNEFMNNLSEEDYQKMIDIMEDNGYGSMAQMMKSIGRDGMIKMHNSMGRVNSGSYGMMGGFGSDIK